MIPSGFVIQELVPPEVFNLRGQNSVWCLCPVALRVLGALREDYGPTTVNNWHTGGQRKYSGFRPSDCGVGATWSQHRYGRAFDCLFSQSDVETVRQDVIAKARAGHGIYKHIGGIELGVSWFHFDTRPAGTLMLLRP